MTSRTRTWILAATLVAGLGCTSSPGAASDTTGRDSLPVPDDGGTPPAAATDPQGPAAASSGSDTLRGIVSEVGSVPVTSIVIRPAGERSVPVLGRLAREIGQAAGADVWVRGRRGPAGIVVEEYAVRAVDGEQAVDGVIRAEGPGLVLVTGSGPRPLARPPEALRGMIGARVWVAGDPNGTITSYGVLREAP